MSDAFAEMMLGHLVCLVQGNAFILVEWAYLGRGKLRWPVLWAELLCMGQLGLSLATGMSFFNVQSVLLNVLYLFVTAQLFGGNFADKLTACLINGTMCLLVENTVNYTYSWFTGVRTGEAWQHPGCLIALCAANLIVGAAVAHFLYSWNQKCALQPLQALVMSFFPGVAVVLNIVLMVTGTQQPATRMTMLLTFGMSVAVLVHIAIVQMFNDQVVQRQNSRYRAQLEQQRAEALLDSILSKKYEEAAKVGVNIYFDLCDLKRMPFDSMDMVIVLSNLLDNATRAAAQALPPEVHVRIRKTPEEYLISVRNRVQEDLLLEEGKLPGTTKKESGHGMGLANVQDVLRKYGAEYTVSCRDRWFRFTCAIPCAVHDMSTDNL